MNRIRLTPTQCLAFADLMAQVGTDNALDLRENFIDLASQRLREVRTEAGQSPMATAASPAR